CSRNASACRAASSNMREAESWAPCKIAAARTRAEWTISAASTTPAAVREPCRSRGSAGTIALARPAVAAATLSDLMILDNELVLPTARDDDFARFLQTPDDCDDPLLRILDILQAHGSQEFHILENRFNLAFRHISKQLRFHAVARRLQGVLPILRVDLLDNETDVAVCKGDDILKH